MTDTDPVSYTHLDVYKRQVVGSKEVWGQGGRQIQDRLGVELGHRPLRPAGQMTGLGLEASINQRGEKR